MATRATSLDGTGGRPLTGRTVLLCFIGFFGVVFTANFFLVRAAVTSFGGVETESSHWPAITASLARHWPAPTLSGSSVTSSRRSVG